MPKYVKIYYRDPDLDTVKKLFDVEKVVDLTIADFLDMKDPYTSKKNRDALFMAYTEQQVKDLGLGSSADISETTKIYPPATLYIQTDKATLNVITNESVFTQTKDYDAFLSEQMKSLVNSRDYVKSNVTKSYPEATLWIWSKSFEASTWSFGSVGGTILNMSDFIEDMRITTAETGGSFQIQLPMIPVKSLSTEVKADGTSSDETIWRIDTSNQKKYENEEGNTERVFKESIHLTEAVSVNAGTANTSDQNQMRRMNIGPVAFSVNDIVFIKFERLKLESNLYVDDLYVDPHALNNEVFDMIGLIDSVVTSTDSGDVSITISGKDCIKMLIDDGSFFFANSYSDPKAQKGIFQNIDENRGDGINTFNNLTRTDNGSAGRFIATGMIMPFFIPSARTIENVLDLLIKTLANIEICPDELFEPYGDKRTRFKKETKKQKK